LVVLRTQHSSLEWQLLHQCHRAMHERFLSHDQVHQSQFGRPRRLSISVLTDDQWLK
jgi:hypothetical protein